MPDNGRQYCRDMRKPVHDRSGKTVFSEKGLQDPAGSYPGFECCVPHPAVSVFQIPAGGFFFIEMINDQFRSNFSAVNRHGHAIAA